MQSTNKIFYNYIWYIVEPYEVFYVGKGSGKRYKQINNRNKFFKDMYNTHKCDVKIVKKHLSEEEAFENEKRLIKWYKEHTNYRLTNQTDGGDGSSGYKCSYKTKEKLSKINKAKWEDKEFYERMLKIRRNPNGAYKSNEFREKISKLVKGEKNPNYNNHWTQEQKEHLSRIRKQNGKSAGIKNPKATKIICIETGEIFDLIKDAMKKYNVKHEGSFTVALDNKTRTAAGLHWKRFNDKLLDDDYRFKVYLDILNSSRFNPYICINSLQIYKTQKELIKELKIKRNEQLNDLKNENQIIVYNNKTYMPISYYMNSPLYQQ